MRRVARLLVGLEVLVMAGLGSAHAEQFADYDDASWALAKEAGTVEAYQAYLAEFPSGRHSDEAFRGVVEGETLAARLKDKEERRQPDVFGDPGNDVGPPGLNR